MTGFIAPPKKQKKSAVSTTRLESRATLHPPPPPPLLQIPIPIRILRTSVLEMMMMGGREGWSELRHTVRRINNAADIKMNIVVIISINTVIGGRLDVSILMKMLQVAGDIRREPSDQEEKVEGMHMRRCRSGVMPDEGGGKEM